MDVPAHINGSIDVTHLPDPVPNFHSISTHPPCHDSFHLNPIHRPSMFDPAAADGGMKVLPVGYVGSDSHGRCLKLKSNIVRRDYT